MTGPKHHPLIGLVPTEEPPVTPAKAPERPVEPLKWCSDCDHPQDRHAPDCPAQRPAAPLVAPRRPVGAPTWREAAAKALRQLARKLESD
jgi:hypothetical protein